MRAHLLNRLRVPAFALVVATHIACAHADPDVVSRRKNCRVAMQMLQIGEEGPRLDWARQYIGFCEPAQQVESFLAAIQRARVSTDLDAIHHSLMHVVHFRDGQLFAALLDVAESRSASVPARVVAFVALASISDSLASPSYDGFIGGLGDFGLPRGRCSLRQAHATAFALGPTPMPPDSRERIAALRRRVMSDVTQPDDVRSAAAC